MNVDMFSIAVISIQHPLLERFQANMRKNNQPCAWLYMTICCFREKLRPILYELDSINTIGADACLEQQLDYLNTGDGDLETEIQARFPFSNRNAEIFLAGFPDNKDIQLKRPITL